MEAGDWEIDEESERKINIGERGDGEKFRIDEGWRKWVNSEIDG